ncbi:MAG TPA: molybdopterin cofactor-binding domain-containing protein, partial [Vicinamibacteria bacterium]|nr:molybdopterin cofactor-binding domain-containing protein [Vicinamibacteria bacterium]
MSELVRQAVQAVTGKVVERALANAPEIAPVAIGTPVSRVDGPLKVTGAATHASDTLLEGMVYAALTLSPIPRGRIISIDTSSAMALPGVIVIYTHQNAPRLGKNLMPQVGAGRWSIGRDFRPLQDDRIRFAGQPVALVIAETWEEVVAAASHVDVSYAAEPVETDLWQVEDDGFPATPRIGKPDYARGDVDAGLARAAARVSAEYATPPQTNNPLGLFATIAHWDGNQLTLYDANQATQNVAHAAEAVFGLTLGRGGVDVITPFVGGGFGTGLRAWPHAW